MEFMSHPTNGEDQCKSSLRKISGVYDVGMSCPYLLSLTVGTRRGKHSHAFAFFYKSENGGNSLMSDSFPSQTPEPERKIPLRFTYQKSMGIYPAPTIAPCPSISRLRRHLLRYCFLIRHIQKLSMDTPPAQFQISTSNSCTVLDSILPRS